MHLQMHRKICLQYNESNILGSSTTYCIEQRNNDLHLQYQLETLNQYAKLLEEKHF